MRCPFCGSHLDNNAKYCNDCGTAVDSECAGKNINYRSYTDTRPNSAAAPKTPYHRVKENNYIPKTAVNSTPVTPSDTEKKNPFLGNIPNSTPPNFTPGQFGQFKGTIAKNGKKSGCGVAIIVIAALFFLFSIIGALSDEFDSDSSVTPEPDLAFEQTESIIKEDGFAAEKMSGRTDGKYYLNDYVNFAFEIPEGFSEQSVFTLDYDIGLIPDCCFMNEDGEYVLVGFVDRDDGFNFLNEYVNAVFENLSDSGLVTEISNLGEKQVYNNDFITQSVSREDGKAVDVYVCPVDDWIFFVEVNTSSADLNNQIADTFVNSYSN